MNLSKKNKKQIMELIIFTGIVLWCVINYKLFIDFLSFIFKLLLPIIVGACIAFIINVPMKLIEKKIFNIEKRKYKKIIRIISLTISIILILGIIVLLMFLVIPEFIDAISTITKTLPKNMNWLNNIINKMKDFYPNIKKIDFKNVIETSFGSTKNMLDIVVKMLSGFISRLITFFIGFILSIYILYDKEKLVLQIKKVMKAFLPDKISNEAIKIIKITNITFTNFLTGQCLDAVLLGILFFISMSILKMPYAVIISVLLAVTALIPYIGAFITLVVGAVLIAVTDPIKAVWYIILFFILQQIDENVTYPKIVGKSVGLPALWTLIAAVIGGSIFGFIGVIISVPISSVLYSLLRDYINYRISKKQK